MKETRDVRYFLPAEWHEQECVQLTWPHAGTDWAPYLDEITGVCINIVKAIATYEKVLIAAQYDDDVRLMLTQRLDASVMRNVSVWQCPNNDTWARDHAFITLLPTDDSAMTAEPRLMDFQFNGWGCKFPADLDNKINSTLFSHGVFRGTRVDCDDFVLEGGSIESDGCGTVFTTSMCLLAPNRNQPMDRIEIDRRLLKMLCADRVVWIDYGRLEGDDTDGHIDTIVRTAPDDTLLYVGCDDTDDCQYPQFKKMEIQLAGLRTMKGTPYRLLRLPMADAIYEDGQRLPATYANFLVINGAVIIPTYGSAKKDDEAKAVVAKAFPGRDVICIDARTVVRQHGSLHCLTMQYPKGSVVL